MVLYILPVKVQLSTVWSWVQFLLGYMYKKHRENREKLPREHLIGCQGVKMFLLKDHFKVSFVISWDLSWFMFCHNLSFWVLSHFQLFLVLSQFEFLSLFTIWVLPHFEFCHNFSFVTIWFLSQLDFLKFCHNLTFWVLSQFEFLSFVTIQVF